MRKDIELVRHEHARLRGEQSHEAAAACQPYHRRGNHSWWADVTPGRVVRSSGLSHRSKMALPTWASSADRGSSKKYTSALE
jgi:hypothetical protein